MTSGWREGRDPSAHFSTLYYKDKYLSFDNFEVNPLDHYGSLPEAQRRIISTGEMNDFVEIQRRVIHDYFDAEFYTRTYTLDPGTDPLHHYLTEGWRHGYEPNTYFVTHDHLNRNQHLGAGRIPPFYHYVSTHRLLGGTPPLVRLARTTDAALAAVMAAIADDFDASYYLSSYDDVREAGLDPLRHYAEHGWKEGRNPSESFWNDYYRSTHGTEVPPTVNPLYHYVIKGRALGLSPNPSARKTGDDVPSDATEAVTLAATMAAIAADFDEIYYLSSYTDVREAGLDPLRHYAEHGWKEGRNPSEIFWAEHYRKQYASTVPTTVNPLYHYVTEGRALGLKPNPFGPALWPAPTAPSAAEWAAASPATDMTSAEVVVVIPVYKGYEETLRAVHAVLANRQSSRFALLVVNDCGPLAELNDALAALAAKGLFVYLENETNLGFVASVNKALAFCTGKDVILLNSDAIPYGDWLDRMLWHAQANPDAATITPLSNNATICSYPLFNYNNRIHLELTLPELDACARDANRHLSSDVPTGVGFCFYMRRSIIDRIGVFDAETFGRGYGEENDFCLRARKAGYRNLLAHDIFVYHSGGASFDNTFTKNMEQIEQRLLGKHPDYTSQILTYVEADPAREARIRLDLFRLARSLGPKTVVFVTHNRIGGIVTHIRDLSDRLTQEGYEVVILKAATERSIRIETLPDSTRAIPTSSVETLQIDRQGHLVTAFLEWLRPALVHIHSFVGLDWASTEQMMTIIQAGGPYAFTLHDYAAVCHRNDLVTPLARYCGLPDAEACRRCIAIDHGSRGVPDPAIRREAYARLLAGAAVVLSPSHDIARRLAPYLPGSRITIRPHEEQLPSVAWPSARTVPVGPDAPLRIASLGGVGPHKGSNVLHDLAVDARLRDLPITYRVVGYSNMPERLAALGVIETGRYRTDEEAIGLLHDLEIDLVLIGSIWPETYCYTLSLAQAAGVPPVAFDLGAQAERLRARDEGALVDPGLALDASALNDLLLGLSLPDLYARRAPYEHVTYSNLLATYYGLGEDRAGMPA
ncbi:glycosyltransferase [Methylobacterium indicum]|nr:glycosyltransferase [Methylobacterium indicum]